VLTLAFSGVSQLRAFGQDIGKTSGQPLGGAVNKSQSGGHGIYVCLSTFRREVIRQSCHMYIRGGGGCGKKQKMMEKMRKRKNKCKM